MEILVENTILTGTLPFQSYPSANFQLLSQISQNARNPVKNRLHILKNIFVSILDKSTMLTGSLLFHSWSLGFCHFLLFFVFSLLF